MGQSRIDNRMQEKQGDFRAKYGNGKIITKKPIGQTTWKQSCECSKKAFSVNIHSDGLNGNA